MSTATLQAITRIRRRSRLRTLAVVLVGAGACLGLLLVTFGLGAAGVPPERSFPALFGVGDRFDLLVVRELRLPRGAAAVVAGVAFGLAGALFQSTLRNNLASPDILGISGGASLGAVTAVVGYGASGSTVNLAAFAGALAAAVAIWALAWRGGLHGIRFVLVGVGIAYLCGSLISWRLSEADLREGGTVLLWTVGSVADVRDGTLGLLTLGVLVLAMVTVPVAREQRALALGDEHAQGLGLGPTRSRVLALLIGVALVALATAVAGPIAFVALVSPAIARRLVDDGGPALLTSAVVGAALAMSADVIGQYALPGSLTAPVGIVTGLVGAPYLLWLLARSDRKGQT
ncbi:MULTISPECIES: FecCD family ABC transporter permease [unclassified Nocardioides]|uniref:FecCD family ABC transporter permease n=1 Tax=unclassified Nocardioides TaxID=2615069 RepID=UPI00070312EA|nr:MULTISPECIES: iron chelate uptake ABC transporter family permease subunit [unclassified Nocardioides]KRC48777.1 ABC transporter permease [Nocardioides sp. Root79]KRC75176.1 ABC transporter permease [Nocardioides sp. Root240]